MTASKCDLEIDAQGEASYVFANSTKGAAFLERYCDADDPLTQATDGRKFVIMMSDDLPGMIEEARSSGLTVADADPPPPSKRQPNQLPFKRV
jgi:hypothetical protein